MHRVYFCLEHAALILIFRWPTFSTQYRELPNSGHVQHVAFSARASIAELEAAPELSIELDPNKVSWTDWKIALLFAVVHEASNVSLWFSSFDELSLSTGLNDKFVVHFVVEKGEFCKIFLLGGHSSLQIGIATPLSSHVNNTSRFYFFYDGFQQVLRNPVTKLPATTHLSTSFPELYPLKLRTATSNQHP